MPGETSSIATDINTAGDVTYQVIDSGNNNHGALLHAGKYYKLDYPKSAFTFAGAVNDHSTIVGGYRTTSMGNLHGYVMDTTAENLSARVIPSKPSLAPS